MMALLPLLLLAPTLAIIVWLYWAFPRSLPRTAGRRTFDVVALLLAITVAVALGRADEVEVVTEALGTHSGAIWSQVLAVLYGYMGFGAVLIVAVLLRRPLFGRGL